MAWSEAAQIAKNNETTVLSDLTAAMLRTARQNIAAAQSAISGDDAVRRHNSPSEISNIYSRTLDSRTLSSWGGNA